MVVKDGEMESKKIKVAYFIGSLNRGGTETLVLDSFRKRDFAPFESILIYRNEGELSDAYRTTGVPMFRVKPKGLKLGYIHKIRKLQKQEGVDVLHTQTLLNALLGIFCTCFSHVKLVASFHGFRRSFKERIYTHLVLWYADASVFVSGYLRDWYINHTYLTPRKRCHLIYNGIDFSKFDQSYAIPDLFVKTSSLTQQCVNMVMVGNFNGTRSQDFLCKVLNKLVEEGVDGFRFYFIGKPSKLYEKCVCYCRDHDLLNKIVFFLGGRGDVPAILQYMDAFVYSTEYDTFGIAVVEAMAAGLPVVVNDSDVMKEITKDGSMALLYRTRNTDNCVEKIKSLLFKLELYKQKAKEISAKVREYYSIKTHIYNLNQVYETVVNKNQRL